MMHLQTSTVSLGPNRRHFPRVETPPMYHPISIRLLEEEEFRLDGHANNLSFGGIQFELDEPIRPGTDVAIMIHLPVGFDAGPGRALYAIGTVVWCGDYHLNDLEGGVEIDDDTDLNPDDPGPARMAMTFSLFPRAGDADRLRRLIAGVRVRRAA